MKDICVIEINQSYVKIAATRTSFLKSKREFFCFAKPVDSLDEKQISSMISDTVNSLKLKPKSLILSLPRNLITLRILSLPSRDTQEISKMVDLHLVRVVPYKKEEVINTYSILETAEEGFSKILLSIIHKGILEKKLKSLTDAGFFVDKIYLSSYGIWEWILANCKSQLAADTVYLGLDIDCDYVELIVFYKKQLLFSRSILFKAVELQDEAGIEKLIKEIKQTILVFRSEYGYKKANKLFICGAVGKIGINLLSVFESGLEIPVELLSANFPFEKGAADVPEGVSVTAVRQFLSDISKSISFFVPEIQLKKALRQSTKELIITGSLIIYVFFIICAVFLGRLYNRQIYLKEINSLLGNIKQDIGNLAEQNVNVDFVKTMIVKREIPLALLRELYRVIDFPVAIKNLSMDENNKVVLRGEIPQLSNVFAFVSLLEASDMFDEVKTVYTRKKKNNEGEVTDFELGFIFKY